jgi:hypothetical protein
MSNLQEMNGGDLDASELGGMGEEDLDGLLNSGRNSEVDSDEDEDDDGETGIDRDSQRDDYNGNHGENAFPTPPADIRQSIERLDDLLAATRDEDKIRAGMGIRLALGMAQELKSGLALGTDTGELVSRWLIKYGQETVDAAVVIARQFLTKPEDMRKALGQRLGLGNQD